MAETSPTVSKKKPPQNPDREATFEDYFQKNIDAIHAWYRKQPTAGNELGMNSMLEITFGHISVATEYARRRELWKPA